MVSTEEGPTMSMYLPNPDVRSTGSEPAEFIDGPRMDEESAIARRHGGRREAGTSVCPDDAAHPGGVPRRLADPTTPHRARVEPHDV